MELKKFLWLLWHKAWLLAVVGLLAGLGAYVFSKLQTPLYEAETIVLIDEGGTAQSTSYSAIYLISDRITKTYAAMLTRQPILDRVNEALGGVGTIHKEDVSVSAVQDTQLLAVKVRHASPQAAAAAANRLVDVLREELSKMRASRYSASKQNLADQMTQVEEQIAASAEALESQASRLSQAEKATLETRLAEYHVIYARLLADYERIRLAEAQASASVVQVQPAYEPAVPVSPQAGRTVLLAVAAGLLAAAALVLGLNILDDRVQDPLQVTALTGLPVLASIGQHVPNSGEPVAQTQPRSPVSEAFRALRTNVRFMGVDRPLKRILVTSAIPEEGKTTVASNLAVVMAQSGLRTLLVDADLRRPRIHKLFKLDNSAGLTNLFLNSDGEAFSGPIRHMGDDLEVLFSGGTPPNPAELLGSKKMAALLEGMDAGYDLVILDTPPVLTVTDAAALSSAVDGVIVVAKLGQTRRLALKHAVEELRKAKAKILGVVINGVDARKPHYYYSTVYKERYYQPYTSSTAAD